MKNLLRKSILLDWQYIFIIELFLFQFSFSDKLDIILLIIGIITAMIQGFIQPWLFYLMGRLGGTFVEEVFDQCMATYVAQCSREDNSQTYTYDRYQE